VGVRRGRGQGLGGLSQAQIDIRLTEAVSNVKSYGEGPVMIWFLEDYRDDVVLVARVQHFEL
jgi:hypothetical protein